jgi:hypothetical protein
MNESSMVKEKESIQIDRPKLNSYIDFIENRVNSNERSSSEVMPDHRLILKQK